MEIKINGIGKDAELETNSNGGKQSVSPMAFHLIDPNFIQATLSLLNKSETKIAFDYISKFMFLGDIEYLTKAMLALADYSIHQVYIKVGEVLKEGATKYKPNNWRLIPQEEHINHALIHLLAYDMNDTQNNHLEHCLCRLMMAYATYPSDNFSYAKFIVSD